MKAAPLRLGILISGGGRTALNLHDHILSGDLAAEFKIVVSSRNEAAGNLLLRNRGLSVEVIPRSCMSDDAFQRSISTAMKGVDLICMCGFLSLWRIPPEFVGRVMNIHPALFPEFGGPGMFGHKVHEAVLRSGAKKTGCTVHFCDNEYDHGPIILQRQIVVLPQETIDSLAQRVFLEECIAYPQAVKLFAQGRLRIENRQVVIDSAD